MQIITCRKAVLLYEQLEEVKKILTYMDDHKGDWWKLAFPSGDIAELSGDLIRQNIKNAMIKTGDEITNQIKAL